MHATDPSDSTLARDAHLWRARTVVVIDDHPVVALGLRLAFKATPRFTLAAVAVTPAEAIASVERLQPDIVISDLIFGAIVEIGLIRTCRRILPAATLVAFSSLPAAIYERETLKAGADRFVPKERPVEALIAVIEEFEARPSDRRRRDPQVSRPSLVTGATVVGGSLTPREMEIGLRLSMGVSVARIGQDLELSAKTVAVHRDNIRRKLNCRDSAELIARLARLFPADIQRG